MLCAFCAKESEQIGWDETSHFKRRPICYVCIGKRDLSKMKSCKTIILYKKGNQLVNYTNTISFRIIDEANCNGKINVFFMFKKTKWQGTIYPQVEPIPCQVVR